MWGSLTGAQLRVRAWLNSLDRNKMAAQYFVLVRESHTASTYRLESPFCERRSRRSKVAIIIKSPVQLQGPRARNTRRGLCALFYLNFQSDDSIVCCLSTEASRALAPITKRSSPKAPLPRTRLVNYCHKTRENIAFTLILFQLSPKVPQLSQQETPRLSSPSIVCTSPPCCPTNQNPSAPFKNMV